MPIVSSEGYSSFAIRRPEAETLDFWLEDAYGIRLAEGLYDLFELNSQIEAKDDKRFNSLQRTFLTTSNPAKRRDAEQAMYALIAKPNVAAVWFSARRAWLLDSLSLVSAVIHHFKIKGSVLDIGTAIGIFPAYLAETHGLSCTGVDIQPEMIETARRLCDHPNADFQLVRETEVLGQYDLVLSIDVRQPDEQDFSAHCEQVANAMTPDGFAVVVGNLRLLPDPTSPFTALGLRVVAEQRLGGLQLAPYGEANWLTKTAFVLTKNPDVEVLKIYEDTGMDGEFAEYANQPGLPEREKNRTYFLATMLETQGKSQA